MLIGKLRVLFNVFIKLLVAKSDQMSKLRQVLFGFVRFSYISPAVVATERNVQVNYLLPKSNFKRTVSAFRLIVLCLALLFAKNLRANHILGGNISYTCLGGDQFQVDLHIYIDCFGATDPPVVENIFFFPDCGAPFSVAADLSNLVEISDLCATELPNSSCSGGFAPGTWLVTYTEIVTLSLDCPWSVYWESGDWNYFININNAGFPTAHLQTIIDLSAGDCGSSVSVSSLQVPYVCMGDAVSFQLQLNNPEGYDLDLSLINVLTEGGVSVLYEGGYSGAVPIPGFNFDPLTYTMSFNAPMQMGSFSIGIIIEQYDALGNFVGSVIESMAFIVTPCIVAPTIFADPPIQSISLDGIQTDDDEFELCAGDTVCFTVEASNLNIFRSIALSSNFTAIFPGATFNVIGTNPAVATLCMYADPALIGSHVVTIDAIDDDCFVPSQDQTQITINILNSLQTAFFTDTICLGASTQLDVSGASSYTWNVISGNPISVPANFSCLNCGNPTASPIVNTVYEVVGNNVIAACNQRDTISVDVALSGILTDVTDESCSGNDGSIDISVPFGTGLYSYDWTGPAGFTAITQDINGLEEGDYSVTVEDLGILGCLTVINISVLSTPPPTGQLLTADITICEGDCVNLEFDLSGTGPFDLNLTNAADQLNVNDGFILQVCPASTTTYTFDSVVDNNTPACTTNIAESVTVTVLPDVNALFIVSTEICEGDNTDLELDIDEAGTFDIAYTDGVSNFTLNGASDGDLINVNPNLTTTYTITEIEYTGIPACTTVLNNAVQIIVNELPTAQLVGTASICLGDDTDLVFNLTGNGPFDVTWTDGATIFTANGVADGYIETVSPIATTNYCITEVIDSSNPACAQILNDCVTITVFTLPTGSVSPDASICAGDQVNLTFDLNGQQLFDLIYTVNAGPDIALNNQVDGAQLNVSPALDSQYCLISITDSNNPACTTTLNSCIDITVNLIPTFDISGNAAICAGDCVDIAMILGGSGPFTISWEIEDLTLGSITPQPDILGAIDGDLINVCANNPSIVRFTGITDNNNPACSSDLISEFDISVQEVSVATFTAESLICDGSPVTLSFTLSNPASGPWDFTIEDELGNQTIFSGIQSADLIGGVYVTTLIPAQNTTYTLVDFTDVALPCVDFSGTQSLTLVDLPTATIGPDQFFCPGDLIFLEVDLPAPGTFDVVYNDGTDQFTLSGIVDGYDFQVSPLITTTYTLELVIELTSGIACETILADNVIISVDDIPQISALDTLCDGTGDFYQITFEITGGDELTYSVLETGVGPGQISAGPPFIYTSDFIPSGDGVSFELDDSNPCDPTLLVIDPYYCPVLTDAGTMDPTPINACADAPANAIWNNDEFLDANDELMFILHDSSTDALGLVYALDCDDSGFNDADTPLNFGNGVGQVEFGVTYYISAVAGNDDGTNDCVDLNHPDISVAEGTPVVFYELPTANISGGGVSCEGGTIDLQIDFSGEGPWEFVYAINNVDQAPIQTNDNPYLLAVDASGDYELTSLTNDFCTGTLNGLVNVLFNPLPDAIIASGAVICEGETFDLSIDFTGTGPWDFELVYEDGINPASVTPFYTDVTPFVLTVANEGFYSVTNVIDATNCLNPDITSTEFIEVTPAPSANIADDVIDICEGETFDIVVTFTGQSPWELIYTIDGVQQPLVNSVDDQYTIIADQSGVYELFEIIDFNNCPGALNGQVTLTVNLLPIAAAGPDITVCSGVNAILGAAATPGLGYSWDNPGGELSNAAIAQPTFNETNETGIPVLYNFVLTVFDGLCQAQDNVIVTLDSAPNADAGADQTICYGDTFQLNAQGGLSCIWIADPTLSDITICDPIASPIGTTTYTVSVEAANGCLAEDDIIIDVSGPLVIDTLTIIDQICFQTCSGEISLSSAGTFGAAYFDWIFPDGSANQGTSFENLCPGNYDLTLSDDLGCSINTIITLDELPEYTVQSAVSPNSVCFGESTGIIEIISPEAVEFELNPGTVETPDALGFYQYTGLNPGNFVITATDAFGCTDVVNITIDEFDEININSSFIVTEICWEDEVQFSVFANGGGGQFIFYWLDENDVLFGEGSPLNFVPTEETTLYAYTIDANNCSSDTIPVSVVFPNPLTADLDPSEEVSICEGDEITISADLGGGVGFPAPVWTTLSNNQFISNQTSFSDIPADDEAYLLTVTDGCAVPLTDTVFVVVLDTPDVVIGYNNLDGCAPVLVELVNLTDEELVGTCLWQFDDGNILPACIDTVNYQFNNPGVYTVSLTVTSNEGCVGFAEMDADVEVYGHPVADFTWAPFTPTNLENEVQLINQTIGGNTFLWDFDYLGTSPFPNPVITLPPVDYGVFPICLTAINQYGCIDTICKNIQLQGILLLYVPNAFTPSGDGLNEVFLPIVSGVDESEYSFRIFDRWGNKIFETDKTDEPWLGNINGGDHYVQNDVYVWQIICKDLISAETKDFKGHVTIIR